MSEHSPWHLLHVLQRLAQERCTAAQGADFQDSPHHSRSGQRSGGGSGSGGSGEGAPNGITDPLATPIYDILEEEASVADSTAENAASPSLELELGTMEQISQ